MVGELVKEWLEGSVIYLGKCKGGSDLGIESGKKRLDNKIVCILELFKENVENI